MARSRTPWSFFGVLSLFVTHGGAAEDIRAESQPEQVRLSYEAPPQCPSVAQLMDRVALRVNVEWHTDDSDSARHIEVNVEPTGAQFTARMQYSDKDTGRVTRSVDAPSCEQAVSAISLVIALTIEERVAPAVETTEPKRVEPQPAPVPARTERPRNGSRTAVTRATRGLHQELGAFVGATYGIGPRAALGAGAWWGLGRTPIPIFRVTGRWHESHLNTPAVPSVESRFRLISATPEACAGRRLGWLAGTVGALCTGLELGQYRAQALTRGASQYRTLSNSLFWVSAELSAVLRLASGGLFAQVQPMVRFPLVSGHFSVVDTGMQETVIHRIPRVAPGLDIALGVSF